MELGFSIGASVTTGFVAMSIAYNDVTTCSTSIAQQHLSSCHDTTTAFTPLVSHTTSSYHDIHTATACLVDVVTSG